MLRIISVAIVVVLGLLHRAQGAASTVDCGQNPADIVFLMDSSGSVGTTNFQKQKQFVAKFAQSFTIGPRNVQIGVVTFSTRVHNEFNLNTHPTKTSLVNAINAIHYNSGMTYTHTALQYVERNSFTRAAGDRPNVANILIVMTDGRSTQHAATIAETAKLHKMNMKVFAIGIGAGVDRGELGHIASDSKHVFLVNNFDALKTLQAELKNTTCVVDGGWTAWGSYSPCTKSCGGGTQFRQRSCTNPRPAHGGKQCTGSARETHACHTGACPTRPPTTKPTTRLTTTTTPMPSTTPACYAQADIMFLLDSSGSVGATNFQKMLGFVRNVANNFNIGPNAVQIGVDTFQTSHKAEFRLNTYSSKQPMLAAINNIHYQPGLTHTGEAIRFMAGDSFSAAHGDRPNVPNVAIIVTDGQSNNPTLTAAEAKKARDKGITIIALGVGHGIRKSELNEMATDPDSSHVYTADNFDALASLQAFVSNKACEVSKPKNTSTPTCSAKADILFILDSSGSIGQNNYDTMLTFVKDIVSNFDIGPNKIQVAAEIFSDRTYQQFNLNKYQTKSAVEHAVSNIPYRRGTTNTGQALKDAYTKMFTTANGDRASAPNIAIVVTDGRSTNRPSTLSEATKLQNHGVQVFAVGVGHGVDKTELNAIATDPDSSHVLTVQNFQQLSKITASLNSQACKAIPPSPLTPTGTAKPVDPCQDQNPSCSSYEIPAVCSDYADWSKDNCKRSCKLCTSTIPTVPPPCVDKLSDCSSYDLSTCTGQYASWAHANCRKFCGFCKLTSPDQVTQGFFGKCYYQGKEYRQSETWDDGCAYECTCDNAAQGRYSCYNKCPVYYNLPPQCLLAKKANGCCLEPVCNFNGKYGTTSGQTTGNFNGVDVCMYKGQPYYQGQTWQDGCQLSCYCQDGKSGLWTCTSQCGTYSNLPPHCRLEKPAGKCCSEPVCDFDKQYGHFSGSGSTSGKGGGSGSLVGTSPAPCVDKAANCHQYQKDTCTNSKFAQWAQDNCRAYCGLCNVHPTPGPNDKCVYNGQAYSQGQRWDDGCDLQCVCENAIYGFYRCSRKCAEMTNLPIGCSMVKKAGECCPTIQCKGQTGTFQGSQLNPGTIGGYPVPTLSPTAGPTPGPGLTVAPGQIPGVIPQVGGKIEGCLYKGVLHQSGMRWDDGCQYTCVCMDGRTGQYRCTGKCPVFNNLPSSCQMVDNPKDTCCRQPKCNFGPSGTLSRIPVPTYGKGFTGYGLPQTPQIRPGTGTYPGTGGTGTGTNPGTGTGTNPGTGTGTNPGTGTGTNPGTGTGTNPGTGTGTNPGTGTGTNPGTGTGTNPGTGTGTNPGTGVTGTGSGCVYKNKIYGQGAVWDDQCTYQCECVDASIGQYRCTDRCPTYQNVPAQCSLVQDPNDHCCKTISCSSAAVTAPPAHLFSQTTPPAGSAYCEYQGYYYRQGETWNDGCSLNCRCEDATHQYYQCTDRCPKYTNVPVTCTFVADPKDPTCCRVPSCQGTGTGTGSGTGSTGSGPGGVGVPQSFSGSFTGYGRPPNFSPSTLAQTGYSNACLYKGNIHQQGESWDDGCSYRCTCTDATKGMYTCNERCKRIANVPSGCRFIIDPADRCCQKLTCAPPTTQCQDNVPCNLYGAYVCEDTYKQWATANCAKYCGICGNGTGPVSTTPSGPCQNAIPNCDQYGYGACVGQYVGWAKANCPVYCKLCPGQTGIGTGTGTGTGGTGTGTGGPGTSGTGTGTGTGTGGTGTGGSGTGTGSTGTGTGGTGTGGTGTGTGGTGTGGTGTGTGTGTGGTGTGTGTGGTGTGTGSGFTGSGSASCHDVLGNCKQYTQAACRDPYVEWARQNCAAYCGLCGSSGGSGSGSGSTFTGYITQQPGQGFTGFSGRCIYKGKYYGAGDQWQDGCDYNCTCQNGQTGYYRCVDRCLHYGAMPAGCVLKKKPGQCCATPDCSGMTGGGTGTGGTGTGTGGTGTGGTGTGTGTGSTGTQTGEQPGCYYKNHLYQHGETWKDGCQYKCTCVDGNAHRYQCQGLCLNWQLPSTCHLDPPATGKCCQTPNCPSNVILNYPPGYVAE